MASPRGKRIFAFWLSVIGHALIVVALTFSISLQGPEQMAGVIVPVETVMIDETARDSAAAQREEQRQADLRRQEEVLRQQQREQQIREDQAAQQQRDRDAADRERIRLEAEEREAAAQREAEQKQREVEAAAEEAARERERQAAERQRQEAEAAARRREEIADQIAAAAAAEQADREATDSGLRSQWAAQISNKVQRNWQRPPNATAGLECRLDVEQLITGEVRSVTVSNCNVSDPNIIRSLENAVHASSPLPARPPGVGFERIVRITFKPTD
jgi:colicin import membrane protein